MICPTCGQPYTDGHLCASDAVTPVAATPTADPLIGQLVDGRYRVEAVLGRGGMGTVYRAVHVAIGRPAALKLLEAGGAAHAEARQRFRREALAASQIDHPNLVTVYDFGQTDAGADYLAMELLEGEPLEARLARGRLSPYDTLRLLAQAADALHAAHRVGVVHRDLKPGNLFLVSGTHGVRLKLLDFGIARSVAGADAGSGTGERFIGTPQYASPEQARGLPLDGRSDLYSLGVIAFECLTGRRPFLAATAKAVLLEHLNAPPPALVDRARALVDEAPIEALIRSLLAKDAADRPADARVVRAQVLALLPTARRGLGTTPLAWPPADEDPSTRPLVRAPDLEPVLRQAGRAWAPLAIAAALAVAGVAWAVWGR